MMTTTADIQLLEHLPTVLGRSLLQYLAECPPWTAGPGLEIQERIEELAAAQREDLQILVDLILRLRGLPNFGVFPLDFSDRQFLAMEFVYPELIEDQRRCIAAIETVNQQTGFISGVRPVLMKMRTNEMKLLEELQALPVDDSAGAE
ncbi:hypothetical protein [Calycomorphotria hydatis]|uniref:Uncharacterized protein n=1 Tax=Calycomorphotria hydatis TaxID=2528027 RepID=A0A517T6N9_9PLAN|nr:hypothetical protein [Calycomorphotria hydatis]QDT64043.1 hypothetical protein V22_12730 [Calycomorphotria hydatis]